MRIDIINILHKRNKTLSWLAEEIGCDYSNLWKTCNNKTKAIKFSTLEKICNALDVGVEEILIIESGNGEESRV